MGNVSKKVPATKAPAQKAPQKIEVRQEQEESDSGDEDDQIAEPQGWLLGTAVTVGLVAAAVGVGFMLSKRR